MSDWIWISSEMIIVAIVLLLAKAFPKNKKDI